MKGLLENTFAPITFQFGFVECPFDEFSQAFTTWLTEIDSKFGTRTPQRRFGAPLSEALSKLEPLTTPLDRYLLIETCSGWTAVFGNGLRIRRIAVTNDVRGWEFVAQGEIQPYEKTENYREQKVVDRFTVEMLESYCGALGIVVFDESFYGGRCLLSQ